MICRGELAQLGERLVCNQEVTGSIPVFSTILRSRMQAKDVHRSGKREGGLPERSASFGWHANNFGFLTTEYSAIGSFFDHITTQSSEVNTWSSY